MKKNSISAKKYINEPIEYGSAFSRGIAVSLHDCSILYISGTASVDKKGKTYKPYNFEAQAKKIFLNLTKLLEAQNASWHDVVFTRIYLKNMSFYSSFNKLRSEFYKKYKLNPYPASVCVESRLCRDDLLVEIEAQAIINKKPQKILRYKNI